GVGGRGRGDRDGDLVPAEFARLHAQGGDGAGPAGPDHVRKRLVVELRIVRIERHGRVGLYPTETRHLRLVPEAALRRPGAHLHLVHLDTGPVARDRVVGGAEPGAEHVEALAGGDDDHPVPVGVAGDEVDGGVTGPDDINLVGVDPTGGVQVDGGGPVGGRETAPLV